MAYKLKNSWAYGQLSYYLLKSLVRNLLLLSVLLAAAKLHADDTVKLCVGESPPYFSQDLDGGGPLVKAVRQVFERAGISTTVTYAPWARLFRMGQEGRCMIVGIWRDDKRDRLFNYSTKPLVIQQLGLYRKRNNFIDIKSVLLGVERGSYISPKVVKPHWQLFENTTHLQTLRLLKVGRVDLAYGDMSTFEYLISNSADLKGELEQYTLSVENKGAYLAASKLSTHLNLLMDFFNKEFSLMLEDGSYQEIFLKPT
ncbi:transporter substrate-binding domain-containing protein [Dasania marina]|uniref:substrate-binding periplasmic protein n=1 Tax=Dasania marina TaxID=471499 RepID=UPI0030D8FC10|tara:strand:- start:1731 stop:2498 length:768 start_codon:yes stop_codon:yes gene_type:complete